MFMLEDNVMQHIPVQLPLRPAMCHQVGVNGPSHKKCKHIKGPTASVITCIRTC